MACGGFCGEISTQFMFDLGGNVRKNPKLSGTTHNVFGIQVGVSMQHLCPEIGKADRALKYCISASMNSATKEQKYAFLEQLRKAARMFMAMIAPETRHDWARLSGKHFDDLYHSCSEWILRSVCNGVTNEAAMLGRLTSDLQMYQATSNGILSMYQVPSGVRLAEFRTERSQCTVDSFLDV